MISYQKQLARKYAIAFLTTFPMVLDEKSIATLEELEQFLLRHKSALFLIHLAGIDTQMKFKAVMGILEKFGLGQLNNLIRLLIDDRRLNILPQVIHSLKDQLLENRNMLEFEISSACVLSDDERKVVEDFLATKTGKIILAEYKVDPMLIAGIRIKSDQYFWEYSVKQELAQVKSAIFMN